MVFRKFVAVCRQRVQPLGAAHSVSLRNNSPGEREGTSNFRRFSSMSELEKASHLSNLAFSPSLSASAFLIDDSAVASSLVFCRTLSLSTSSCLLNSPISLACLLFVSFSICSPLLKL